MPSSGYYNAIIGKAVFSGDQIYCNVLCWLLTWSSSVPYWSLGDIAETFGLVEFASVVMLVNSVLVGQCVIRMFGHVGVTITHRKRDIVSAETYN